MGMFEDVLAWVDNKRRVAGRNVSDLWNDPMNALQKTAANTLQTVRELPDDPANFIGGGMGMFGATAWHGSPHKFDKFRSEAIGTGEGAQAYGHGLYLAESPEVAKSYAENLANRSVSPSDLVSINGKSLKEVMASAPPMARAKVTSHIVNAGGDVALAQKTLDEFVEKWKDKATLNGQSDLAYAQQWMKQLADQNITFKPKPAGELYKTDIPDEAVARFLDWDKPLSQHSEQVKRALFDADIKGGWVNGAAGDRQYLEPIHATKTGKQILDDLNRLYPGRGEELLKAQGIPGIRYLDGGSRSAGQGSSNFVVFDPEMIRILERNGQATGKMPWKRGEFDLKDTTYEPPLFPDTTR